MTTFDEVPTAAVDGSDECRQLLDEVIAASRAVGIVLAQPIGDITAEEGDLIRIGALITRQHVLEVVPRRGLTTAQKLALMVHAGMKWDPRQRRLKGGVLDARMGWRRSEAINGYHVAVIDLSQADLPETIEIY